MTSVTTVSPVEQEANRFVPTITTCPVCSGDLQWSAARGDGTIYAFTTVHQVFAPSLTGDVPCLVALVDLVEGPRLVTRLVGLDAPPRIGDRVRVDFQRVGDQVLPVFRPA
jgi:uncharacterized OB-fold protein